MPTLAGNVAVRPNYWGTIMKLEEIRNIAKAHHINPGNLSKSDLVKSIQTAEGNYACFASAYSGECDQTGCAWRTDCFGLARKGALS